MSVIFAIKIRFKLTNVYLPSKYKQLSCFRYAVVWGWSTLWSELYIDIIYQCSETDVYNLLTLLWNSNSWSYVNELDSACTESSLLSGWFSFYLSLLSSAHSMMIIQTKFSVKRNWAGDPCSPATFSWDDLNCSYTPHGPPRITGLWVLNEQDNSITCCDKMHG